MTTRRLILIRHAKAETAGIDDAQRQLAPRGERDAREVGRWLEQAGVRSGVAAVSPARRTVQTWDLAVEEMSRAPRTVYDKRIYQATVDDLLAVISQAPPRVRTLVIVGHNPSIEALAVGLDDGQGNRAAAKEIALKFPTSAIAVLDAAGPWTAFTPGRATLVSFTAPRG